MTFTCDFNEMLICAISQQHAFSLYAAASLLGLSMEDNEG